MKNILLIVLVALSTVTVAQDKNVSDAFIVKPYLQIGRNPSSTSLQLLWHALDVSTKLVWAVEYRTGTSGAWKKIDIEKYTRVAVGANAPRRVYNAPLSGLTPGSMFNYRILRGGKVVFSSEGVAPKSAEQPYRFVAFADIGAGTPEQKPLAHRAFLSKPDLVVVPGDIVYERGLVSEYDTTFWPIYNADKASEAGAPLMRSIPFAAAPGNHDTDTRDLNKYPDALAYYMFWDQPLNGPLGTEGSAIVPPMIASEANRKAFLEAAGEAYPKMTNYSFNYSNAHWTVLDSNPYMDWTDKELNEWVAKDLASAKDATWRFVMFHHPGFNSAREHYEQQHMRLLSTIFEQGKVDIVFTGHVHNYQRSFPMTFVPDKKGTLLVGGKENKTIRGRVVNGRWTLDKSYNNQADTSPQGVIYLVTGAGGQHLYNPEQNDDPDSWQKFTDKFVSNVHSLTVADVNGKTITVRQLTAEGKELDSFKITKE
ncbi:MAG: metallophosphoesterase [Cyclobacteriaceae bacterium]